MTVKKDCINAAEPKKRTVGCISNSEWEQASNVSKCKDFLLLTFGNEQVVKKEVTKLCLNTVNDFLCFLESLTSSDFDKSFRTAIYEMFSEEEAEEIFKHYVSPEL